MPLADCAVPSVTVPGVPMNTAVLFATQAAFVAPLNHFEEEVSQAPVPPSPAPFAVLLFAALPSPSQYTKSSGSSTPTNGVPSLYLNRSPVPPSRLNTR